MSEAPSSFEVCGFTIEVHAGGRRVRPPSFKHFVKTKLDQGKLTVAEVMKTCNVSQSLIYKWRSDVKAARKTTKPVSAERLFSEVVVEEETQFDDKSASQDRICFTARQGTLELPSTYPVNDLVKIILAITPQP